MARFNRNGGKTPAEAAAQADAFSGHSMRAGYVTTASEMDAPGYRIRPDAPQEHGHDQRLYPQRPAVDEVRFKGCGVLVNERSIRNR
jgi:hypothetical protein